jgi:hypothetical protein
MDPTVFYIDTASPALRFAAESLRDHGGQIVTVPGPDVTHLLLPVPATLPAESLENTLAPLPPEVTLLGGNLDRYSCPCRKLDLLEDKP